VERKRPSGRRLRLVSSKGTSQRERSCVACADRGVRSHQ
jgi:hypothetical protein